MELLGKIFGNKNRVKIMRLFLFHVSHPFETSEIAKRARVQLPVVKKEIAMLAKIGFLKKKPFSIKVQKSLKKKTDTPTFKTVKKIGWVVDTQFSLIHPLKMLLLDSELINEKDVIKRLRKAGTLKLVILSGLFLRNDERELDLLVVGNRLKKDVLEREISHIESEIGRELQYAFFDVTEFAYRVSMYDKLVRDILENKHKTVIKQINY